MERFSCYYSPSLLAWHDEHETNKPFRRIRLRNDREKRPFQLPKRRRPIIRDDGFVDLGETRR